ncbi:nSTAND1 domain-containing NTPase [Trichormus variabilis]|uniref:Restriction endonuclease type IV Mrr domain-containing protein n=1 Tax=Trichormus variabilis SAG 1403-4b TaxID=447716 RepID=A0A433UST5_ANAVA|nr:restriction endonuclease [Trichormus variabilis]MBD2628169.1 restriction endonuclease [Trichormus variabilis FACHB-164]RUS96890.1 hypothetical protein DSM107003_22960 [Trichormus variabilis SAG 1403-4b]
MAIPKEIVIWANEEDKSFDKGKFFEELANKIFSSQRYKVDGNIQYTGREFDLQCTHLDRINERCLVECKAKQSLSTTEIRSFVFNTQFNKLDYGFFLYTSKYEKQVGGLIKELEDDPRYKNLYFWDAEKVIELLVVSTSIKNFQCEFQDLEITKLILVYSYFGTFYVVILSNSTVPSHFSVFDAIQLKQEENSSYIEKISGHIEELSTLQYLTTKENVIDREPDQLETVAEIQESDSWDDYKPASTQYFVGRKVQKEKLFNFLSDIRENITTKRVFYIDGKSGWGKSSLMSDLRGRCRNQHYKNKYYAIVIDSRSANSHNFLPLSYKKLIEKAAKEDFIPQELTLIKIPSSFDILGDISTERLCEWLDKNKKSLVIIFDQFEDVFKKEKIFKSFYKFLIDISDKRTNIILGFSWKSEVNIPIDHEAYHLWQQSKDHAYQITLDEFDTSESKAIIKQLENDIYEKLNVDFIRKIVDNSQGYPWLVKKLCIHIKRQYHNGIDIESLYDQDFQVESLFNKDVEELTSEEIKALRYIAKRGYDNQSLDITELDEVVESNIVQQLIHKRYVIKSGTKYNIYWDIFRDFLVLNEIPPIGETYLIRQPVNSVFEAFNTFFGNSNLTLNEFISLIPNSVAEGAALNLLRELRSVGLISYKNGYYYLKNDDMEVNEYSFKDYMYDKLSKHSFTQELKRIENRAIEIKDLQEIIKRKIRTNKFADKTLETYSQIFLSWLDFSGIEIPNISSKTLRRAKNALSYTPQMSPNDVENYLLNFEEYKYVEKKQKHQKLLYDLKSLGLTQDNRDKIDLTEVGQLAIKSDSINRRRILSECALRTEKIKFAYGVFCESPHLKSKNFKPYVEEVLEGINSQVYINTTSRKLYLWASYIYISLNNQSLLPL